MKSSLSDEMQKKTDALAKCYETTLRKYLTQRHSSISKDAVKLGRQVVALGLETMDVVLIHEKVIVKIAVAATSPAEQNQMLKRAGKFFADVITPLEEGHRVAIEANMQLNRMNTAVSQRTLDIVRSEKELKEHIVRRKFAEEALEKSEKQSSKFSAQSKLFQDKLRQLSRRILLVQEEERKRISRELHDVVAHVLTGVNVRLAALKIEASANSKGMARKISSTQRLVERSVDIVHRFARELRPAVLDDLGLIPALHSYMNIFSKGSGVRVSLTAFAGVELLNNMKRTVLYRIVQEALTNVERHAHASQVDVFIEKKANHVVMRIKDNGKSFDLKRIGHLGINKRLGLLGMRERAEMIGGKFEVESTQGHGTTITVAVPINKGLKELVKK